jgi:hypothetical protein
MEKDIGRVKKNDNTDIIVRIDDFGGKAGVTIREFVNDSRTGYKGFTKAGTRIPAEKFLEFRELVNAISLDELKAAVDAASTAKPAKQARLDSKKDVSSENIEDY